MLSFLKIKEIYLYISFCIISIFYITFFTIPPSNFFSGYDTGLFIEQAMSIGEGRWLGEINRLSLVKNPFISIYLSCLNSQGIDFMYFENIFYFSSIILLIFSFKNLSPFSRIFLFFSLMFLPGNYSYYRQTIMREDLIFILYLNLITCFSFFYRCKNAAFILLSALIVGVISITYESSHAEKITFFLFLIFYFFNSVQSIPKRVFVLIFSLLILNMPTTIIRHINYEVYNWKGTNLWWDSGYKKAYESLISIKLKNQVIKERVPWAVENVHYVRKNATGKLKDILQRISPGSLEEGVWGPQTTWVIYWAINEAYETGYDPVKFNKAVNEIPHLVDSFCRKYKMKVSCDVKGFGFVPHPSFWSQENPFILLIKNIYPFFANYFHHSLGESYEDFLLRPINRDGAYDYPKSKKYYQYLGYSNVEEVKQKRSTSYLYHLQRIGYVLRALSFFLLLFLLVSAYVRKIKINYSHFYRDQTLLLCLFLFLLKNGQIFLYYTTMLKRAHKYISLPGVLIPVFMVIILEKLAKTRSELKNV